MPDYIITMLGVEVTAEDDEAAVTAALTQLVIGVDAAMEGKHPVALYISRSGRTAQVKDWDTRDGLRDQAQL